MAASKDPIEELKRQGPRPVYAIDGEERLLVNELVKAIKDHSLPPQSRDFNLDVFTGKEVPLSRIVDAAQTLPAFAERRVVVVNHAEKLDLEQADVLLRYLDKPSPTSVLIFVAEKFDGRTKVYKAFKKVKATIRFERPKPREMPTVIKRRAELMGIKIDGGAIRVLADTVGTDISEASKALELLSLYVGPDSKKPIKASDVEAVVSVTREESIFALVDAIGMGNRSSVLRGLHGMLDVSREHPLRILAMVARHYRNLIKARSGLDARASKKEIQGLVGISPYFMEDLLKQARRQNLRSLVDGLTAVTETDRELKGGVLDGSRAMERLALRLIQGGTSA